MGLSSLHIRTQDTPAKQLPAVAMVYEDGNLARVSRVMVEKPCLKCGRPFRVLERRDPDKLVCTACQTITKECKKCGRRWHGERWPKVNGEPVKVYCPSCGSEYRGNKRDVVSRFSENSRRRLMRKLATIHKSQLPTFVTLTFPDSWHGHEDPELWKSTLRRFELRFRRKYPTGSYIWRLDTIDRKSGERIGELSPHYHCLVFGVSHASLRLWVPGAWYEAVGTGDEKHLRAGTQVARVRTRRGVMAYASKAVGVVMGREMGKNIQTTVGRVGRWWGVVCKENFVAVVSAIKEVILSELGAVKLIRIFRRMAGIRGRDYQSLTTFFDGAHLLLLLPRLTVPAPAPGRYKTTGRSFDVPFSVYHGSATA